MTNAWPGTAEQVRDWIRAMLRPDAGQQWSGLDQISIQPRLEGADLAELRLDATGRELRALPAETTRPGEPVQPAPAVVSFQTARLRELHVTARPVRVQGYDISLDLRAADIDIDWTAYAAPLRHGRSETAYAISAHEQQPAMTAVLDVSMRQTDLAPMIRSVMDDLTRGTSVRLRRLQLRLDTPEPGIITGTGAVSARWKFLGARVRAVARIRYTDDGVLQIEQLELRSRNPLLAVPLRMARRVLGRAIDLNEHLGGSARMHGLRVEAGEALRLVARVRPA